MRPSPPAGNPSRFAELPRTSHYSPEKRHRFVALCCGPGGASEIRADHFQHVALSVGRDRLRVCVREDLLRVDARANHAVRCGTQSFRSQVAYIRREIAELPVARLRYRETDFRGLC